MSSLFTSESVPGSQPLHVSNGLAAVLLDVLVIAGVDHATTAWETQLVYWLIQHDTARVGLGMLGFDIAELGWTRDGFTAEKQFVLAILDAASRRHGWDRLPFQPPQDLVLEGLESLRTLVSGFPADAVGSQRADAWVPGERPERGRCEVHRAWLHDDGCILCNDAPIGVPASAAPHRSPG